MWREGGTKTSSEEHHFTSLSSFLSLPSFSVPFVVLPGHFSRQIKEKSSKICSLLLILLPARGC